MTKTVKAAAPQAAPRPSGLTRTQLTIADMLRAAGRKVTVIDATRDQAVVDDEILRVTQDEAAEKSEAPQATKKSKRKAQP